ncbi:MAG: hypothetical protein MHM6MM_004186 [Cercozoa sp. M6MM]
MCLAVVRQRLKPHSLRTYVTSQTVRELQRDIDGYLLDELEASKLEEKRLQRLKFLREFPPSMLPSIDGVPANHGIPGGPEHIYRVCDSRGRIVAEAMSKTQLLEYCEENQLDAVLWNTVGHEGVKGRGEGLAGLIADERATFIDVGDSTARLIVPEKLQVHKTQTNTLGLPEVRVYLPREVPEGELRRARRSKNISDLRFITLSLRSEEEAVRRACDAVLQQLDRKREVFLEITHIVDMFARNTAFGIERGLSVPEMALDVLLETGRVSLASVEVTDARTSFGLEAKFHQRGRVKMTGLGRKQRRKVAKRELKRLGLPSDLNAWRRVNELEYRARRRLRELFLEHGDEAAAAALARREKDVPLLLDFDTLDSESYIQHNVEIPDIDLLLGKNSEATESNEERRRQENKVKAVRTVLRRKFPAEVLKQWSEIPVHRAGHFNRKQLRLSYDEMGVLEADEFEFERQRSKTEMEDLNMDKDGFQKQGKFVSRKEEREIREEAHFEAHTELLETEQRNTMLRQAREMLKINDDEDMRAELSERWDSMKENIGLVEDAPVVGDRDKYSALANPEAEDETFHRMTSASKLAKRFERPSVMGSFKMPDVGKLRPLPATKHLAMPKMDSGNTGATSAPASSSFNAFLRESGHVEAKMQRDDASHVPE